MIETLITLAFLSAIVLANLSVATFGQAALPITAFVLIPFDLVARDVLHERWQGRLLILRMATLIVFGSALTTALSWGARRVALASTLAFASATTINAIGFHLLRGRGRMLRMNASNALAAVTDSIVFPVIAFWSAVDVALSAQQAASKFIGGLFWSGLVVAWLRRRKK